MISSSWRLLACATLLSGCAAGFSSYPLSPGGPLNLGAVASVRSQSFRPPRAAGVTYETLHDFQGGRDGAEPRADLIAVNGNLYGTTSGFNSCGTVFEMTMTRPETVLHDFGGSGDGCSPYAPLIYVNGTFYGTTYYGGSGGCTGFIAGCGTVFAISASGGYNVLYSFQGDSDGEYPQGGLTYLNGTLYGTTSAGGTYGGGTVFEIAASGQESVLHEFGEKKTDGGTPVASMIAVNGVLYGTTMRGGDRRNGGTVYSITTSGKEKVIHSFIYARKNDKDGEFPLAALIYVNGIFYGTTSQGGLYGSGTIFSVVLNGREKATESVRYNFTYGSSFPVCDLTYLNGELYGTTAYGGEYDVGTIFELNASGTASTVYSFGPGHAGDPYAGLTALNDVLYGTLYFGGTYNDGAVFSLTL